MPLDLSTPAGLLRTVLAAGRETRTQASPEARRRAAEILSNGIGPGKPKKEQIAEITRLAALVGLTDEELEEASLGLHGRPLEKLHPLQADDLIAVLGSFSTTTTGKS